MKVHIFIPCFIDQLYPQTGMNMVKVLEKACCEVIYNPKQTCCGQPAYNSGFTDEARPVCRKFLHDFSEAQYIVTPSASCGGFIRNYYHDLFAEDADLALAKSVSSRVYEFTEFLTEVLRMEHFGAELHAKAVYHSSCASLRECKLGSGPLKLLEKVKGLELQPLLQAETCCGFGGTFAVKFDDISAAMADQKIQHAKESGAELIISTDQSCLMHLEGRIKARGESIQTMHIADVLASGWEH